MTDHTNILCITASARKEGSISRDLTERTLERLSERGAVQVTRRDVADGVPFVDGDWVAANFTRAPDRTDAQKAKLSLSDALVEELSAADIIVIGTPIYNFGIPASLKAWVDMICRAGLTFKYTESGPVGLLEGKRAIVLVASGGTPVGSQIDHATPYLKHALSFVGIQDVTFIAADGLSREAETKIAQAREQIAALTV